MDKIKKNIFFISLFFSIFLLDRISKILIINQVENIGNNKIYDSKFLNLELVWNKGVAFGLFSFSSSNFYNLMTFIILIVILIIIYFFIRTNKIEKLLFLIIFSAATGNLYDRIVYNSVPDFIDIHVNNFHWFVFNVSDIFITIGVIGLILNDILLNKK
mgnify:CR=1 FL=1